MKYKKFYESRKPGLRPVSVWVNVDPERSFNEIIVGQNISENNIKGKRFDYPVEFCYCSKSLKEALRKFDIEKNIKNNENIKNKLSQFVKFI